jgi:hypothetical protein
MPATRALGSRREIGKYEAVIRDSLNPRYVQARGWYALFYLTWSEERLEEGVAQAKLALESDPLSAYAACTFGFTCCLTGRYAEGLRACEHAVELDSESFLARYLHGFALYFNRRFSANEHWQCPGGIPGSWGFLP